MGSGLGDATWPLDRLGEAMGLLAAEVGGLPRGVPDPRFVDPTPAVVGRWVEDTAAWLGLEAESVHVTGAELELFVREVGPALLLVGQSERRILVIRRRRGAHVRVLRPDHREIGVPVDDVVDAILETLEPAVHLAIDRLLVAANLPGNTKVRRTLLRNRIAGFPIAGGWLLRLPPSAPFLAQLQEIWVVPRLVWLTVGQLSAWFLAILAWWTIGRGALSGQLDAGWLTAWALLTLSSVPLHAALVRAEGRIALDVGARLKQRLLLGALRLQPEEVRHQGMGQLLGRVIESEAVEAAATTGALFSAFAVLELGMSAAVLAAGAGGWTHALLLVAWSLLALGFAGAYARRRSEWSDVRLSMTNALVESLMGHRTRLAQEHPDRWHVDEDAALARYVSASGTLDRAGVTLSALVPSGWVVVGLLGLAPALASGGASAGALAVSVGGVVLAQGSIRKLVSGVGALASANIAWSQVRDLFAAAARPVVNPPPVSHPPTLPPGAPLLEAHGVTFRHAGRAEPVLRGLDLSIAPGDRLLLEGPSGGGKSTLGSLLAGLRPASSGILLLAGLDHGTLGAEGWRRRVVTAPQFHENHVIGAPLAFNLLMGRSWPAEPEDMQAAEELCRELGLGELLDRMPSGIMQMVGETGWQLSHGEKSRLFIARALLQGADLVVLDESFAALDPENLGRALRCVLARSGAVLVIAHP